MVQESISLTTADSSILYKNAYLYLRGLEKQKTNPAVLERLWFLVSYMPHYIKQGMQFASGYAERFVDDPTLFNNIEEFFYTRDKRFRWYPIANINSSYQPRIGIDLTFRKNNFETMLRTKFSDRYKYSIESRLSYQFEAYPIWRLSIGALLDNNNDRRFFGFGAVPDPQSGEYFLENPHNNFGVYQQLRRKIQIVSGIRLSSRWACYLASSFQQRRLADIPGNVNAIGRVFDISRLPGMQRPVQQFYNEIWGRFDTRNEQLYISPGHRIEGYIGYSRGFQTDHSAFMRGGLYYIGNYAIIQKNRFLTPRLVFDFTQNLASNPIPFCEYPRHPSFRGVSQRKILRADNFSLVPSLEYQWPLSFNLNGHLFMDVLLVSNKLTKFNFEKTPWAIGIGTDFHAVDEELARAEIAYGTEGIRLLFHFGFENLVQDRSEWE
ncbi:hypothetical protein JW935_26230 [candidate division KSB1 bacterium]|nr:hypothetical protein [candidate division KSB1 bacterium]